MHYKVLKGVTERSAVFDSSWTDKSKANDRAKTLRGSLRGSKINVYVLPLEEGDEVNQKPRPTGGWDHR